MSASSRPTESLFAAQRVLCDGTGRAGVVGTDPTKRVYAHCPECGRDFGAQGRKAQARIGNPWEAIPRHFVSAQRKQFDPDWVIAPGETLAECIASLGMTARIAATLAHIERPVFERIISGDEPITPEIAQKLCNLTNVGAPFWLALEHNFRVGIAAGKSWVRT